MRPGLQTELWRLTYVGLFSLLFGFSVGQPLLLLIAGGVVYLIWSYRRVENIFRWIDRGMRGTPPDEGGVWSEFGNTLNRQKRRDKSKTSKLRATIARISSLTEALDEGIIVLRKDLTVDLWNSAAKHYLQLRSSDRGTPITNLLRQPEFVRYIRQRPFSGAVELPLDRQTERTLKISASEFGRGEIVVVIHDVSALRQLEQLRREFVGNVSHELRTPLTVIKGYTETLAGTISQEQTGTHRALEQISQQVKRMQALADDLIVMSKLESETSVACSEPMDLLPALEQLLADAKKLSNGRHQIQTEGLEQLERCQVLMRSEDCTSAVGNILFNAVRHNPQGCDITLTVVQRIDSVEVTIRDEGVGIDSANLPRITERFFRGDNSRNSDTGGTGLGLAIVKHTLQRYGADLTITSQLGRGSAFTCQLPKAPSFESD